MCVAAAESAGLGEVLVVSSSKLAPIFCVIGFAICLEITIFLSRYFGILSLLYKNTE